MDNHACTSRRELNKKYAKVTESVFHGKNNAVADVGNGLRGPASIERMYRHAD